MRETPSKNLSYLFINNSSKLKIKDLRKIVGPFLFLLAIYTLSNTFIQKDTNSTDSLLFTHIIAKDYPETWPAFVK